MYNTKDAKMSINKSLIIRETEWEYVLLGELNLDEDNKIEAMNCCYKA